MKTILFLMMTVFLFAENKGYTEGCLDWKECEIIETTETLQYDNCVKIVDPDYDLCFEIVPDPDFYMVTFNAGSYYCPIHGKLEEYKTISFNNGSIFCLACFDGLIETFIKDKIGTVEEIKED